VVSTKRHNLPPFRGPRRIVKYVRDGVVGPLGDASG
jgi:hypothetical protein